MRYYNAMEHYVATLACRGFYVAASLGLEPRQRDPESLVLPLHHEARRPNLKPRPVEVQVATEWKNARLFHRK
jgi:hypothetical protein